MQKPTFPKLTKITPGEIKKIRAFYRMTQEMFARFFPVSMETIKSWENDRSNPYGPCNIRLQKLKAYADHVKAEKEAVLEKVLGR